MYCNSHLDSANAFVGLFQDLGRRMTHQSGNVNATSYLKQRLSMAIQQGNAISVLGTCNFLPLPDFLCCLFLGSFV